MESIAYFYPEGHTLHRYPGHPERPERVEAIVQALETAGLWASGPQLAPIEVPEPVLLGVHSESLLRTLAGTAGRGGMIDNETYLTPETWDLALKAAGGACASAAAVWDREVRAGFALCRPPGHHATPHRAMGFCLLNNVAVAAEFLLRERGAERVAVVDLDLHHGNGTQDIFYDRGDVLFISTHQHPLYPGTGALRETGAGEGEGATVNLPLPPFSGDQAFDAAVAEVVVPALERFRPDFLLVSAGMDAHWRDPLGHLQLTAAGYHRQVAALSRFAGEACEGRIALVLEGGYDLTGGSACALGAASALLGRPFSDPAGEPVHRESSGWRDVVDSARRIHNL